MAYRYTIQLASYQESEDPKELFVSENDYDQARETLKENPAFQPWASTFTYQDGRIDFQADQWTPDQPGITQAARILAQHLNARIFGEDDEEYSS